MATKRFKCKVCGYIHEGDAAPEKCPVCQAPASEFEEITEGAAEKPAKKGLNTDGNTYTIIYSCIVVIIVAFLLAFVSKVLEPQSMANVRIDKKSQILAALNLRDVEKADVENTYAEVVVADEVIDKDGNVVKDGKSKDQDGFAVEDKNISDERIEAFDLRSDCYLNNRLGDFLKELKLTEGRSTGIPRVLKSLEDNGSDPPVYETDEDRRFLRVIIPIHSGFLPSAESGSTVPGDAKKNRTSQEIKSLILESLRDNGCQSGRDLAASIGYSSTHNTFRRCVRELMDEGKIEYKYPDNPRDRRQKICLPRQRV